MSEVITWYLFVELKGSSATFLYSFRIFSVPPDTISTHLSNADSDASPTHSLHQTSLQWASRRSLKSQQNPPKRFKFWNPCDYVICGIMWMGRYETWGRLLLCSLWTCREETESLAARTMIFEPSGGYTRRFDTRVTQQLTSSPPRLTQLWNVYLESLKTVDEFKAARERRYALL